MLIEVTSHGSVAVALIAGEIDLANGSRFADEVLGHMPDETAATVLDLTELRYIDSAGVRSLFEIASALMLRGEALLIALPEGSPIRSVLKISGVEEVAGIYATLDEAVAIASGSHAGRSHPSAEMSDPTR